MILIAFHIIPLHDIKEHVENISCKCKPLVMWQDKEMIIIHNSFDKREYSKKLIEICKN